MSSSLKMIEMLDINNFNAFFNKNTLVDDLQVL